MQRLKKENVARRAKLVVPDKSVVIFAHCLASVTEPITPRRGSDVFKSTLGDPP